MAIQSQRKANSATWKRIRALILNRDNHICAYCGESAGTVDHVIPVAKGGSDEWDNLVACCTRCNSRKRDKMPADFLPRVSTNLLSRGFISPQNTSQSYE